MVKSLKNLLLQNQESFEAEFCYIALGKVYQVCANDDPRLTFNFIQQDQICIPMHLYGDDIKKSFSQNVLKANGWN